MSRTLGWFVLGGSAAAAGSWWWRRHHPSLATSSGPALDVAPAHDADHMHVQPGPAGPMFVGRWVWPVPMWDGRVPKVSDGFASKRPGLPRHGGVDIMFARKPSDPFPVGSANGTKGFVMPDGLVAVAASDGIVWQADDSPTGHQVVVDHGPVATYYAHLESLLVTPTQRAASRQRVVAGQPLGIIGASPRDGERIKHLHFEIWNGPPSNKLDPETVIYGWTVINPSSASSAIAVARNGGFRYRPIGASGERYPSWVSELDGKAGVYIIREIDSRTIVYVGSSTSQLYNTLTRHFATWRRYKGFWRGQYSEGHDPGLTYERSSVEVAVRVTPPDRALDEEARLIRRLKPRDNLLGQVVEDAVPF